ncbi:uncharacterized protein LOC134222945 [Armigeres subalbatus]|uniref:uncharacterized protein LOC134222945 n=1 Tax=Armigeres subalbatus TaxID=124917 RepID=UPI002ED6ACE6
MREVARQKAKTRRSPIKRRSICGKANRPPSPQLGRETSSPSSRPTHQIIEKQKPAQWVERVQDDSEEQNQAKLCSQITEILKSVGHKVYTDPTADSESEDIRKNRGEEMKRKALEQEEQEKQEELEAEWREFVLWKQDKLYKEATSSRNKLQDDDTGPPKSSKSQKSRLSSRERDVLSDEETDDEKPPKSHKRLLSSKENYGKDTSRRDKRPPESIKSRKSHKGWEEHEKNDRVWSVETNGTMKWNRTL